MALLHIVVDLAVFDRCQLVNQDAVRVKTIQTVGRAGQHADKSHVGSKIQVALPFADSTGKLRGLLPHIAARLKRLARLLALGRNVVDLGRTLAVVNQQIDLHRGNLGGLTIFTTLNDHALLVLPQAGLLMDKTKDCLPACALEQLQPDRLAEPSLRLPAEGLDKGDMPVGLLQIKDVRGVFFRVPDLIQQHGAQHLNLLAGDQLAGQHQYAVLLKIVRTLWCGLRLGFPHHAPQQRLSFSAWISCHLCASFPVSNLDTLRVVQPAACARPDRLPGEGRRASAQGYAWCPGSSRTG